MRLARTTTFVATLTFLLVASTAVAQTAKDAETRWHEAYVLEVVEGRIDEAAKAYLELLREKDLPDRLRRESEFRFAVCCALLGRADEGRSRLAGLLSDRDLPDAFRARVQEYLKALADVGVGSELEKKLQELLFELGRALKTEQSRVVYRDFQIIGKPAVPFLEKLLRHPDGKIRTHAYRILCEMKEPVITRSLPPTLAEGGYLAWQTLRSYLLNNPEQTPRIEDLLLDALPKLDPKRGIDDAFFSEVPGFSARLAKALAERDGFEEHLTVLLSWMNWTPEVRDLASGWIREGRPALAEAVSWGWIHMLGEPQASGPEGLTPDAAIFPAFCRPFHGMAIGHPFDDRSANGLVRAAGAVPAEVVLATIEGVLSRHEKGEIDLLPRALLQKLSYGLQPVEERVDVEAYGKLVRRWLARKGQPLTSHVRYVCRNASDEETRALIRTIRDSGRSLAGYAVPYETARDVETHADRQSLISECLQAMRTGSQKARVTDDWRKAVARAFPRLLAYSPGSWSDDFGRPFAFCASRLTVNEAREALLAVLAGQDTYEDPDQVVVGLFGSNCSEGLSAEASAAYHQDVRIPVLEKALPLLRDDARSRLVYWACKYAQRWSRVPGFELADARDILVRFLAEHADEVIAQKQESVLVLEAGTIPLTSWVARSRGWKSFAGRYPTHLTPERVTAVLRHFRDHPEKISQPVMSFAQHIAPEEEARAFFDFVYERADPRLLEPLLLEATASPEAMENGLVRYLEKDGVDLRLLARLASKVAEARPSVRLVPVSKRLMSAAETQVVLTGVRLAGQLGRQELTEPLVALLDSMDVHIRKAAQEAVDAILTSARLREEALRRLKDR